MTYSYPLALPLAPGFRACRITATSVVAGARSPYTGTQQFYVYPGMWWGASVELPPMDRPEAEEWISFLLKLNGMEGTFLLGDPLGSEPRGSWAGTPLVNGAAQTGRRVIVDGFTPGATVATGDLLQIGDGATARLYKNLTLQTADVSGELTLDIWPRLRTSPTDNAPVITRSPVGQFRLATNETAWDEGEAQLYGLSFPAVEAI